MKKTMMILMLLLLVGCSPVTESKDIDSIEGTYLGDVIHQGEIHRFIDEEYDAVCWVYTQYTGYSAGGGISCIPIKELR